MVWVVIWEPAYDNESASCQVVGVCTSLGTARTKADAHARERGGEWVWSEGGVTLWGPGDDSITLHCVAVTGVPD